MRPVRETLVGLTLCGLASGCWGTYGSRFAGTTSQPERTFVGANPFGAVSLDLFVATHNAGGCKSEELRWVGIASVPLDLVIDIVFLPFDLIAWPFGLEKNDVGIWSRDDDP